MVQIGRETVSKRAWNTTVLLLLLSLLAKLAQPELDWVTELTRLWSTVTSGRVGLRSEPQVAAQLGLARLSQWHQLLLGFSCERVGSLSGAGLAQGGRLQTLLDQIWADQIW